MRLNMLIAGAILSVAGFSLILFGFGHGYFTASVGVLNLILATATRSSPGVTTKPDNASDAKLVVDKGVVGTRIYQLAFLDGRLVMKKIASFKVTIVLALILALSGLLAEAAPIGAISGGLTGYSMQEYLTQKNRDSIAKRNTLSTAGRSDLVVKYNDLEKAGLRSSSLLLFLQNGVVRVNLPRGYAGKIRETLETILGDKYEK